MFDKSVYIARRKVLASKISSGVVLMLGNSEAGCNYTDNTYVFRQDSTFLYYFGLDKPDLAAVIDVESGEEIIFGDDVEIGDIIWMGPQPFLKDQAAEVGVAKTAPLAKLEDYVKEAAAKGRTVHF
ncbi:MAG: aminopeptidase P N-terminal domain-containing protein, partial [Bacteroidales bacterium]|nr:aminopeptidase P N-terminal domain-containing protein [Bacteroidales bacterium]